MMQFEIVRDSIINNVLGPAESGQFRTIGFQRQSKNLEEIEGNNRTLQVYFSQGDFPKSGGSISGANKHLLTFKLGFSVSSSAELDLSVLNDENATDLQRSIAIQNYKESAYLVDLAMDEFYRVVYQILMNAVNQDLGLDAGLVADRWVDRFQKDDLVERGTLAILTASAVLTCTVSEDVLGDELVPGNIFDAQIKINEDPNNNLGIKITN